VAVLGVVPAAPIAVLADGSYLAQLHPARKGDGPPITVRVIENTVHTTGPGGAEDSSEVFGLVTDLLDPEAYPALDLACAYPMRWCSALDGRAGAGRYSVGWPPCESAVVRPGGRSG
jgi:hypothetical protein